MHIDTHLIFNFFIDYFDNTTPWGPFSTQQCVKRFIVTSHGFTCSFCDKNKSCQI